MPGHVRVSAKAVIIEDGRILLTRNRDDQGDWYLLPGGGQRHGETLHETLVRECREETGCAVEPGRLLLVRDYIGAHHEFAAEDADAHQVELMFACRRVAGAPPPEDTHASDEAATPGAALANGPIPDSWQTGVAWIPLADLPRIRIYPRQLAGLLAGGIPDGGPVYLGDVN
ncbi:MAG: NUDIX domain-containing protein [Candidatus Krumholzibacteriota bacterium]|nr:NUDIX domain-containing protein [Candidatus Krumholzibacteriota bacterium]